MGKIIRNGIDYSGTSDTADNIIYNNALSGLNATTAQEAIDELSKRGSGTSAKLLWENPNPSSSFAAQEIQLNSDDYDYLKIFYYITNDNSGLCSQDVLKGEPSMLFYSSSSSNAAISLLRKLTYVSDTIYNAEAATKNGSSNNTYCIPYKIYGCKFNGDLIIGDSSDIVSNGLFPLITNDNYVLIEQSVAHNSSYTVPESGWYILKSTSTAGTGAIWYLDIERTKIIATSGIGVNLNGTVTNNTMYSIIPLKAGTTLYTRNVNGTKYEVCAYIPMKQSSSNINDCKFIFNVLGYGNADAYTSSIAFRYDGFSTMGSAYRTTYNTPNIGGFPRISSTMPNTASGGNFIITFPGTHTITVEENTLGIDVPSSFTDSLTLSGWTKNGSITAYID